MARYALPLSAAMLAASSLSAFALPVAPAENFSYTGTLLTENSIVAIDFTVGDTSIVTLRSYSYAGGTMADGTVILSGGFDPVLSLFDASGALIAYNDDGYGIVPSDPVTGADFDVYLSQELDAGDYTVVVSAYANFPSSSSLDDGFTLDGHFYGRTNAWAFDVLNVAGAEVVDNGGGASAVPLPAAAPLMAGALGVFGLLARRRRRG